MNRAYASIHNKEAEVLSKITILPLIIMVNLSPLLCETTANKIIGRIGKNSGILSVRSIAVNAFSEIYILDNRAANIKVFSNDGKLIRIIGRKGQGPGEFSAPVSLDVSPDNILYVFDVGNHRISKFDRDGKILKEISSASYPRLFNLRLIGENRFAGVIVGYNDTRLIILDEALNELSTIGHLQWQKTENGLEIYPPTLKYAVINDQIYWGNWLDNELAVSTLEGKIKERIVLNIPRKRISTTEKEFILKRRFPDGIPENGIILPNNYPYYFSFQASADYLYFLSFERGEKSGHFYYLYCFEDHKLRRIFLDPDPLLIKGNRYYSSIESELGDIEVHIIRFGQ